MALIFVAFIILGSIQSQQVTPNVMGNQPMSAPLSILRTAAYDSPNITASLSSPANGSTVSGTFDIVLDMTSDFVTLNLTLFVDGAIYPAYNNTAIIASSSWIETISVDSTTLSEGMLNFTVLFENLAEKESVYLLYFVDNSGPNFEVALYTPANLSTLSGIVSIDLNITSDYDVLNLTVFVDGETQSPYTPLLIGTGNVSVIIDTSSVIEGFDNFTLFFEYEVLATHFSYSYYLVYLVDNDGVPITIDHQSPANQSEVSGVFNLTLIIGSEYDPLNFTLFVEGVIPYSQYNNSHIGIKDQIISINTTYLDEGALNFTLLFEYNVTGENAHVTYYLIFTVNNYGAPNIVILAPTEGETVTGLFDMWLNITSLNPELYLNITIDHTITSEFNATPIVAGAFNYSLNASRYENGNHAIIITAYTSEGAYITITRNVIFLDYVRVWISSLTSYSVIKGDTEFNVRVETPYDNISLSLYVDDVIADDVQNITLVQGSNTINFDTTQFSEGEHNVTLKAYDDFGHKWEFTMVLVIDNYGPPTLRYATTNSVVTGYASFTLNVDSDWNSLVAEIFVDDVIVSTYNNVTVDVSSGTFTFHIDVGEYSKTEHTVRVIMTTEEGESGQTERVFGFASFRIEEIASFAILLGLGIIIPLFRWRKGAPLKPVILLDAVFAIVVIGAFLVLGINTVAFFTWHFNMASIWAIGGTFVFANWALPFILEESEK